MQILILLSAMIASLTGFVAGERPVARAQVERSVEQRGSASAAVAGASQQAARPSIRARDAKALPCPDKARGGAEAAPVRSARSILLLKRAWLE
ncbi:hypothetical protein [Sphingobium sp. CR28]|uniref:hypothetical protein n=1 Tax=Sphingobium sp. CR28 TaxID=3400272 RepID=UPI003FEFD6B5